MMLLALSLFGCPNGLTLPPKDGGHDAGEKLTPSMKRPAKERRPLIPMSYSGPAPPEPGIVSSQCNDMTDGGPVAYDEECITALIKCGETIVGHTIGGVQRYNTRWYEKNFCTPGLMDHDGGDERIYRLDMPDGDWTATVTLDTPCADLSMAAFAYADETCPPSSIERLHRCDMWPKDGNQREKVVLVSQKQTHWYIAIEGPDQEEGAFAITVQCNKGLW